MARTPAAQIADKYELYQKAVQCVEAEVDFVARVFKKHNKRPLRHIKEDFCGTAATSCEFVRRHKDNRALGVDLDPEPLAWGRAHNLGPLGKRARHVTLLEDNVLHVRRPRVEAVLAMNFSYFLFTEREDLKAYFENARASLVPDGMLFLDLYGGYEAQVTQREKKKCDGFVYVWDQRAFNPIDNLAENRIHFRFPDGSEMKNAFRYKWRLWSAREITDLLQEAGFRKPAVYWEGWDEEEEEGNGIFRRAKKAENCAGWIAYIVARK